MSHDVLQFVLDGGQSDAGPLFNVRLLFECDSPFARRAVENHVAYPTRGGYVEVQWPLQWNVPLLDKRNLEALVVALGERHNVAHGIDTEYLQLKRLRGSSAVQMQPSTPWDTLFAAATTVDSAIESSASQLRLSGKDVLLLGPAMRKPETAASDWSDSELMMLPRGTSPPSNEEELEQPPHDDDDNKIDQQTPTPQLQSSLKDLLRNAQKQSNAHTTVVQPINSSSVPRSPPPLPPILPSQRHNQRDTSATPSLFDGVSEASEGHHHPQPATHSAPRSNAALHQLLATARHQTIHQVGREQQHPQQEEEGYEESEGDNGFVMVQPHDYSDDGRREAAALHHQDPHHQQYEETEEYYETKYMFEAYNLQGRVQQQHQQARSSSAMRPYADEDEDDDPTLQSERFRLDELRQCLYQIQEMRDSLHPLQGLAQPEDPVAQFDHVGLHLPNMDDYLMGVENLRYEQELTTSQWRLMQELEQQEQSIQQKIETVEAGLHKQRQINSKEGRASLQELHRLILMICGRSGKLGLLKHSEARESACVADLVQARRGPSIRTSSNSGSIPHPSDVAQPSVAASNQRTASLRFPNDNNFVRATSLGDTLRRPFHVSVFNRL